MPDQEGSPSLSVDLGVDTSAMGWRGVFASPPGRVRATLLHCPNAAVGQDQAGRWTALVGGRRRNWVSQSPDCRSVI